MKSVLSTSKILLVAAVLSLAFSGCDRRPADQTSGASGTGELSGASKSASGSEGRSSGSSNTSGASGSGAK